MILTKTILIRINNKNIEHYKSQGIDVVYGELYDMDVKYVSRYSKYKILAKCETCGAEKELPMQKYHQNWERSESYNCKACNNITYKKSMLEKYGYDNPAKMESSIKKRKETCLEKYGNEYVVNSDYSKEKTKIIFDEKYDGHPMRNREIKNKIIKKSKITKIKRGLVVPDEKLTQWELYRRTVRNITNSNKKKLMESWDGFDYYDGEYIKDNFNIKHTDYDFPTMDHKISIIYGFKNNIPPEDIGDISNLCMTKKGINSSKSFLTEDAYNKKNQS
jgi:hypothetical protein